MIILSWCQDNDEMLCMMEKTKMVVFRGEVAEDPVVSSGYLARYGIAALHYYTLFFAMIKMSVFLPSFLTANLFLSFCKRRVPI